MKIIKTSMSKSKYALVALLIALSFSCSPEDGADGAPGPQGVQGPKGDQGEQGPAGQDAAINITAFQPPGCQKITTLTNSYQKITDLGTFTKLEASSFIEIDYQTNFYAVFSGATGVVFQVRVNDVPTSLGQATLLLKPDFNNLPGVIHGVFPDLPIGLNTVSIWVRQVNGTATNAEIDKGCWNTLQSNNVVVKEFM